MQTEIEIQTSLRKTGKGQSKKLRANRQIPAVIYGPKTGNISVFIDQNIAIKYTGHGFENIIFKLKSEEKSINGLSVLAKSVARTPVTNIPEHIDFYVPDMTKTVKVHVEVKFDGKPAGAQEGGLLTIVRREVEIECLPGEIPEAFHVDVSGLELNHSLHASDIKIDSKLKLLTPPELTLCSCSVVAEEKEPVAEEAADAAAATPAAPEKK